MFNIGTFLLVVLWRLFLAYHNANLRKSGISFVNLSITCRGAAGEEPGRIRTEGFINDETI